jgi:uracil-DNA glycosylase
MRETLEGLIAELESEARRAPFPVDRAAYERAGLDPHTCILYAGSLDAKVGFFARDLGRDEVAAREPLIGAGGTLVREGVYRALGGEGRPDREALARAAKHVLLSNTVPWKPPGNKAYTDAVKNRFRPFITRFLTHHWRGSYLITLGTEAFQYFAPYAPKGELAAFWKREDHYEREFAVEVPSDGPAGPETKTLTLAPLPHPSPLNQRFYHRFPAMLDARLAGHLRKR